MNKLNKLTKVTKVTIMTLKTIKVTVTESEYFELLKNRVNFKATSWREYFLELSAIRSRELPETTAVSISTPSKQPVAPETPAKNQGTWVEAKIIPMSEVKAKRKAEKEKKKEMKAQEQAKPHSEPEPEPKPKIVVYGHDEEPPTKEEREAILSMGNPMTLKDYRAWWNEMNVKCVCNHTRFLHLGERNTGACSGCKCAEFKAQDV